MKQRTFEEFIQILQEKKKDKKGKQQSTIDDSGAIFTRGIPADPAIRAQHFPDTNPGSKKRKEQVQREIVDKSGAEAIKKELKRRKAAEKKRKKAAKQ